MEALPRGAQERRNGRPRSCGASLDLAFALVTRTSARAGWLRKRSRGHGVCLTLSWIVNASDLEMGLCTGEAHSLCVVCEGRSGKAERSLVADGSVVPTGYGSRLRPCLRAVFDRLLTCLAFVFRSGVGFHSSGSVRRTTTSARLHEIDYRVSMMKKKETGQKLAGPRKWQGKQV